MEQEQQQSILTLLEIILHSTRADTVYYEESSLHQEVESFLQRNMPVSGGLELVAVVSSLSGLDLGLTGAAWSWSLGPFCSAGCFAFALCVAKHCGGSVHHDQCWPHHGVVSSPSSRRATDSASGRGRFLPRWGRAPVLPRKDHVHVLPTEAVHSFFPRRPRRPHTRPPWEERDPDPSCVQLKNFVSFSTDPAEQGAALSDTSKGQSSVRFSDIVYNPRDHHVEDDRQADHDLWDHVDHDRPADHLLRGPEERSTTVAQHYAPRDHVRFSDIVYGPRDVDDLHNCWAWHNLLPFLVDLARPAAEVFDPTVRSLFAVNRDLFHLQVSKYDVDPRNR